VPLIAFFLIKLSPDYSSEFQITGHGRRARPDKNNKDQWAAQYGRPVKLNL
jgi:hypothetical protein